MPATVFMSYSHADEAYRAKIEKQLSTLRRQGIIDVWHDRRIEPGQELHDEIDQHVERASIFLLLVSSDFLDSDYCYEREMTRALERHQAREAVVIPVIVRPCDWLHSPLSALKAVPEDGKPVILWPEIDTPMLQVTEAVRQAAARLGHQVPGNTAPRCSTGAPARNEQPSQLAPPVPWSSNLRLPKTFTQRDRDQFRDETFDFIARFFEGSLAELARRNPGFEGAFRRVDANRFFATIYRNGDAIARATVFMGGMLSGGINYLTGHSTSSNALNENLSVEADDETLFVKPFGMGMMGSSQEKKLSQDGAAEYFWSLLIEPLRR